MCKRNEGQPPKARFRGVAVYFIDIIFSSTGSSLPRECVGSRSLGYCTEQCGSVKNAIENEK